MGECDGISFTSTLVRIFLAILTLLLFSATTSTRLLAHKIQSPQEHESLQALIVLEHCAKNCGESFQNEIGKYRFLNELIKVVSPKVLFYFISYAVMLHPIDSRDRQIRDRNLTDVSSDQKKIIYPNSYLVHQSGKVTK